ncbi:uncharacterized protein SPPG_01204 [Spizellomyces punctatus DAOM BR117]|uniref:RING-type domain-containing protein n=1 Tax=Spizellomyces punctatus (strain DAOM BR117) TaxID=645134 RepID=A0A0L0HRM5_SPIPD|nr:uncharacterized protein SPPG_01204 [Spizellomyces punctatus DAOM BR117]KND03748.1 hypothetical protein SPPG_01204 [Spizellomyces punctatus DAOM BR117]|eukprot:XP_016611787.1 hypothetical protein SPPG_01204 [Spizellomyces punctatus DAOM BR117]
MLPSVITSRASIPKVGANLKTPAPPPQPTEEQIMKGGHALRKLKSYCEELYNINDDYREELSNANVLIQKLISQKNNLEGELQEKNDRIAFLRQREQKGFHVTRTQEETERLLHEEIRKRLKAEDECSELTAKIEQMKADHETYRRGIEAEALQKDTQKIVIEEQKKKIAELELFIKNLEFDLDEQRVLTIKFQRTTGELEMAIADLNRKHDDLTISESTFRDENSQLQKRVRDLMDANKEVTANYQAVKKNQDLKRSEFEALATELEEAKNACQMAIRQKKQLQNELNQLVKQRNELTERNKAMENLLSRKEKDISDLLTKVNDTINDYEQKLEKKEEQMWAMSLQMTEAVGRTQAPEPPKDQKGRTRVDIDPDFIDNIEKKWQSRERSLQAEVDRLGESMAVKEKQIEKLNATITELNKKQFQPRMERLRAIEKDIKNRMEEYALAEERMETGFLCPRDVQLFKHPMTLIPCGHTYCKPCIESIKEENYNVLACQVCSTPVEHVFRNEQLESVEEQFQRRKNLTISFLEWIKLLKVYLPSDTDNRPLSQ